MVFFNAVAVGDPHDLGDQSLPALATNGFEVVLEVSLHRRDVGQQAEETEDAGEAGKAAGPGHEFRPVGARQSEQFANHR